MKLIKSITTAIAALAVIALTGCYIPEGTVRITGGSGQSLEAEVYQPQGESLPTTLQTTINLNLVGEQTKGFTEPTYGTVNFQDLGNGLHIQGTVVELREDPYNFPHPGIGAFCVGRAKAADGTWSPVVFNIRVLKFPTELDAPIRSLVQIFTDFGYAGEGVFAGGNFVFHGQNGVVLK